ncbi:MULTISPECIES: hypothetical protein [unclassified Herbaspirillum]|uniref:hypothetical protein n=1 Tax=unclassified Herbaspirillum TaxID=2624150 RepID=UPI0011520CC8|nr:MULTISPECIES: hypothetical protein [unclassified Herbaspirillum]MBB5391060.1 hypothetical protein [Herbaspirillum sp. SJZ102]
MTDMSIDFFGGNLDGQNRSPINEEELASLGYRLYKTTQTKGEELVYSIAVPTDWTPEESNKFVMGKLSPQNRRR